MTENRPSLYTQANSLCNEIDGLMVDASKALAGYPCRREFEGLGKLQEAFTAASRARGLLLEAEKVLNSSTLLKGVPE
ncbi:hypothetical protein A7981_05740 [Methylovorus sp. MM2]|nr:hypothetical protein A7981_05740 [Methylovorus sp. MM2]